MYIRPSTRREDDVIGVLGQFARRYQQPQCDNRPPDPLVREVPKMSGSEDELCRAGRKVRVYDAFEDPGGGIDGILSTSGSYRTIRDIVAYGNEPLVQSENRVSIPGPHHTARTVSWHLQLTRRQYHVGMGMFPCEMAVTTGKA